jgi:hypothetical protein
MRKPYEKHGRDAHVNRAKHIKKLLRDHGNRVAVEMVETDQWGGDRVLGEFKTFGTLHREALLWRQRRQDTYGPPVDFMMDLPMLIFHMSIYNPEGTVLHREVFHDLDVLKKFLIGGFDGVVSNDNSDRE